MSEPFVDAYGPYELEMKLCFTDGDRIAVANVGCGHCGIPTAEDLQEVISGAIALLHEQVGDEWRLCTKKEYFNHVMSEKTGTDMRFAMPGGVNFIEWPKS